MNVDAPPYSPPVEKPWSIRKRMSSTGDQKLIDSYDGIRPMAKVLMAISSIVMASTLLRPMRSPRGPKNMPPMGRMRKATAKVASEDISRTVSFPEGKNTLPIVTAR